MSFGYRGQLEAPSTTCEAAHAGLLARAEGCRQGRFPDHWGQDRVYGQVGGLWEGTDGERHVGGMRGRRIVASLHESLNRLPRPRNGCCRRRTECLRNLAWILSLFDVRSIPILIVSTTRERIPSLWLEPSHVASLSVRASGSRKEERVAQAA